MGVVLIPRIIFCLASHLCSLVTVTPDRIVLLYLQQMCATNGGLQLGIWTQHRVSSFLKESGLAVYGVRYARCILCISLYDVGVWGRKGRRRTVLLEIHYSLAS
ncbi:hypothetical protein BDZ45DRAFT_332902 [Acephala macrosclerotiorum]|nr:hypothetical protein BDZ45DRAFT_332902 [Acephala macrosclerotiorum]